MGLLRSVLDSLASVVRTEVEKGADKKSRYKRLWWYTIIATATVSIAPLVIMTGINYGQYKRVFRDEMSHSSMLVAAVTKQSLEFYLEERRSALTYLIESTTLQELSNP
ncbi:MAG: hypothetical protein GF341_11595, partial [candidate division Zixibacteria bacterium]|nr:hypothetical protein [candidate division Zixibacteria bacterium]